MSVFAGPNVVIRDGLVLCLDAANTKSYPGSGTTWTDLSGLGNGGTLTNGPTFNSTSSGSIIFDGTNDFSTIGNSGFSSGTSPATISVWARMTARTQSTQYIVSYGSGNNFLSLSAGYIEAGLNSDYVSFANGTFGVGALTPNLLNTWFNFVGVFNGSTAFTYINSSLMSITSVPWTVTLSTARVGCGIANTNFFPGNVSHVSVYNRALIAGEVQQNFNALRGRYGL